MRTRTCQGCKRLVEWTYKGLCRDCLEKRWENHHNENRPASDGEER